MAVNMIKGQKLSLTKLLPALKNIFVELSWQVNSNIDLDVSAFLLNSDNIVANASDFIFYNNLKHKSGAVEHLGDCFSSCQSPTREIIKINFSKMPSSISKIVFAISIHDSESRQQNFRQLKTACVRIIDSDSDDELLRYNLNEQFSLETALIVGELYRHGSEWKFNAIGSGFSGGLHAIGRNYGLRTENKSATISVSLYPAEKSDLKKLAAIKQTTMSDIVSLALRDFLNKHRDEIKRYDDFVKNQNKCE